MHRILLGGVIAVVVLAVGAVVAVVLNGRDTETPMPSTAAQPASAMAEKPEVDEPDFPELSEPVTAPPAEAEPKVSAAATTSQPDAATEEGGDVRQRMATLLDSLTDEERQALVREHMRRRRDAWIERRKYSLPTDGKLRRLDRLDDALKLSEVQRAQIEAAQATFKPQIEMALQDIWAQQSDLRQRMRDLWEAGQREEAGALREQASSLREESGEIKAELDAKYTESLAGILSAEQIEAMATMPESSGRDRRGRRGRGGQ